MELRDLPRTTDRYGRPAYLYTRAGATYRIERQAGGKSWHAIAPDDGRSLCADKPTGRKCLADLNDLIDHWQMQAHYGTLRAERLARQEAGCDHITLLQARHSDRVRLPVLFCGELTNWTADAWTVDHVKPLRTDPDVAMLYFQLTDEQQDAGEWRFTLVSGAYYAAGLLRLPTA